MKRRRHTPEQIVRKLREVERLLGEGQTIAEAAKRVEISEQTYHRWRNQYGGMKAADARRPRRRRAADGVARLLAWPPPPGLPPGVGDLARGGMDRKPQAGATALA